MASPLCDAGIRESVALLLLSSVVCHSVISGAAAVEMEDTAGDLVRVVEGRGWKNTGKGRVGLVSGERWRWVVEVFSAHIGERQGENNEQSSGDEKRGVLERAPSLSAPFCPLTFLSRVTSDIEQNEIAK